MNLKLFLFCALFYWKIVEVKSQSRIVGGMNATKSYPYQVSIEGPDFVGLGGVVYSWRHYCGGSIITKRQILTAAHCIVDEKGKKRPTNEISILVGTNDLSNGGTRYSVCKTFYHRKYLTFSNNYDIALITVTNAIAMVPGKVASIPYSKEWTDGNVQCVLTGWGSLKKLKKGPYPQRLQVLYLSTISYEKCLEDLKYVNKNNICTLSGEGKGGCSGDSGGPLVDVNKHVQVGVITEVNGGCASGKPDVYTRTSAFFDWIQQHTADVGCGKSDNSANPSDSINYSGPVDDLT